MPGMFASVQAWFRKLLGGSGGTTPTTTPPSTGGAQGRWEPGNGVSSFHLWWDLPFTAEPITEVAATLEILQAPTANRLYFWALQASFFDKNRTTGAGAHAGLQWNPRHPGSTAVNWGGYGDISNVGSVMRGSESPLPSTPNDPNTRDFPWKPRTPYRFRISPTPGGGAWRCEVTDTTSGQTWLVRDLGAPGDNLRDFVVWAEVFAACDHPTSIVRWSDFTATTASGTVLRPRGMRATFPSGGDCTNTNVTTDDVGFLLTTNTVRTSRDGATFRVPAGPANPA